MLIALNEYAYKIKSKLMVSSSCERQDCFTWGKKLPFWKMPFGSCAIDTDNPTIVHVLQAADARRDASETMK